MAEAWTSRTAVLGLLIVFLPVAKPTLSRVGRWVTARRCRPLDTHQLEQELSAALLDEGLALSAELRADLLQPACTDSSPDIAWLQPAADRCIPARPLVSALARAIRLWQERGEWPWHLAAVPDMTEVASPPAALYSHLTEQVRRVRSVEHAGHLLDALGEWGILSLLRCRRSAGSIPMAPPEVSRLLAAFCAPHASLRHKGSPERETPSSKLSAGARALSKHCHRSASGFWGEISGSEEQKNAHALWVLQRRILAEAVWMNLHLLPGSEPVFEVRQAGGYGARWSADGQLFRGFVEPHAWDVARRAAQAEAGAFRHPEHACQPPVPVNTAQPEAEPPGSVTLTAAAASPFPSSTSSPTPCTSLASPSPAFPSPLSSFPASAAASTEPTGAHTIDMTGRRLGTRVCIVGYGLLVDELWARQDTPSLSEHQLGWLQGYARCFNLVSIINLRRGNAVGRRLASCTAVAMPDSVLRVALFWLPTAELPDLLRREARLRPVWVTVEDDTGAPVEAILFAASDNERYLREACGGDAAVYHAHVGQFYSGELYRQDLLPVHSYMMRCLRAHRAAGRAALANFLDRSFLGDGVTPLREYLRAELLELTKSESTPGQRQAEEGGALEGRWTELDRAEAVACLDAGSSPA
jgi:hypothetical protein